MNSIHLSAGIVAAALLGACQSMPSNAPKATAVLEPTKGSTVRGTANFVQAGDRVRLTASVSGLKPNSEFGFHVHEAGDCSSGDGMSTKGHFNPHGKAHGAYAMPEHHAGDMPSLRSDGAGNATVNVDLLGISVSDGPASVVGRGLIVHAQQDDFKTQPTGNAGARSACAVIQRS